MSCSHLIPAAFGAACCGTAAAAAAAVQIHPRKLSSQQWHIKAQRIVAQDIGAREAAPDLRSHRSKARLACIHMNCISSPTTRQLLTGPVLGFEPAEKLLIPSGNITNPDRWSTCQQPSPVQQIGKICTRIGSCRPLLVHQGACRSGAASLTLDASETWRVPTSDMGIGDAVGGSRCRRHGDPGIQQVPQRAGRPVQLHPHLA